MDQQDKHKLIAFFQRQKMALRMKFAMVDYIHQIAIIDATPFPFNLFRMEKRAAKRKRAYDIAVKLHIWYEQFKR